MKFKLNELVYIHFYDHSVGDSLDDPEPIKISACGIVVGITDKMIVLSYFEPIGDDKEVIAANREVLKVIKSTITFKKKLPKPRIK